MTNTAHTPETDTPLDPEELKVASRAIDRLAEDGPVSVDPDLADAMGAFADDALTPEDALDSLFDGQDPTNG
jgi:hypothetical protein